MMQQAERRAVKVIWAVAVIAALWIVVAGIGRGVAGGGAWTGTVTEVTVGPAVGGGS
jgi:hypothetical protein